MQKKKLFATVVLVEKYINQICDGTAQRRRTTRSPHATALVVVVIFFFFFLLLPETVVLTTVLTHNIRSVVCT